MSRGSEILNEVVAPKLEKKPDILAGYGIENKMFSLELDSDSWSFNFDQDGRVLMKQHYEESADCRVIMSSKNFEKLCDGKLNIPLSLVTGKIKIKGDKVIAAKVAKAIQGLI